MLALILTLLLATPTAWAVPGQFTQQGRLLDEDGVPIEGEVEFTFRMLDADEGGNTVWGETHTLSLENGFYSAVLGADEADNPLDVEVLDQAPLWLEIQITGESPMWPRQAVGSVPYAAMAGVAEEVAGGPVDATEVAVSGAVVINDAGEWVGPAPTVTWDAIEGMPEDFADGVDDDTDTNTDTLASLGVSCIDGDLPVWDAVLGEWVCGLDQDTLADLGVSCIDGDLPVWDAVLGEWACGLDQDTLADLACVDGQVVAWSDLSAAWVCADDSDRVLTEAEVDAYADNNGYAAASDLFSGLFTDLTNVPDGLSDGDDVLSEAEVDAYADNNGYALAADLANYLLSSALDDALSSALAAYALLADLAAIASSGSWDDLSDVPSDLADGDDDTTLTDAEVDAYVVNSALDLAAGTTIGGSAIDTIPSGAVMFFNLSSCPSGWTALSSAQGRYLIGLPASGTLEATVGTALTDSEDRPTGRHAHYGSMYYPTSDADLGKIVPGDPVPEGFTETVPGSSHAKEIGTISEPSIGTNAPYVQLLVCVKD
jgi:hypothetical protein